MQVTKFTSPACESNCSSYQYTERQMYDEINYFRAEKMSKKMLDKGLITPDECDRILAECRKIFVSYLAQIS